MVINFCGFRRRPRPNGPSSEKDSVMNKLMAAMKVKKRRLCWPEKQQEEVQLCIDHNCKKVITLEDLIVSSPGAGFNNINTAGGGGGETPMHKQSSSRKIHPSFDGDLKQSLLPVSAELNLPAVESGSSSLCRTRSGKARKKVSFRSPEVADVFLLHHSPPPEIIHT